MATPKRIRFQSLLEDLQDLRLRLRGTPESPAELARESFDRLITALKADKESVYPSRLARARDVAEKSAHLLRPTTFELMEHDFHENTHSNVLEYLFDYHVNGEIGTSALAAFIRGLESLEGKEDLAARLQRGRYTVEREKSANGGRIDLFIQDREHKTVLVLENKVLATVGERYDPEDTEVTISQLETYKRYVTKNYPDWSRYYLLLSYQAIEHDIAPFIFADYKTLEASLSGIDIPDPILSEYRLLLYALNHGYNSRHDLMKRIRQLKDPSSHISLTDLELITGLTYGL